MKKPKKLQLLEEFICQGEGGLDRLCIHHTQVTRFAELIAQMASRTVMVWDANDLANRAMTILRMEDTLRRNSSEIEQKQLANSSLLEQMKEILG